MMPLRRPSLLVYTLQNISNGSVEFVSLESIKKYYSERGFGLKGVYYSSVGQGSGVFHLSVNADAGFLNHLITYERLHGRISVRKLSDFGDNILISFREYFARDLGRIVDDYIAEYPEYAHKTGGDKT